MTVRPARRMQGPQRDASGTGQPRWRARRVLGRDWAIAYRFVAPLVLLLFGLIGYPLIMATRLSFTDAVGRRMRGFVGLENYARLWQTPDYREMLLLTAKFVTISLAGQCLLGLVTALLLGRATPRRRGLLTGLVILPWVVPDVVAALTWRGIYDPINGALNQGLLALGLSTPAHPIVWLDRATALSAVSLVNIWKGAPYFAILLLAGLQAIDRALYDAAAVDGANGWQRFRHVTLPGLRYVLGVAALLSILFSLNAFTLIALLTNGGPSGATTIFPLYVSRLAGGRGQPGGAAAALSLAPFLLPLIVILGRGLRGNERTLDRPPRAWTGPGRALVWLARLPMLVLDTGTDAVARASGAVWGRIRPRDAHGDAASALRKRLAAGGSVLALGALLTFALGPFYWIVVTAFKTNQQITIQRSPFWPDPWTTFQFNYVLTATDFPRWFANTVRVAGISCAVTVLVGALGAYALARLRFRGAGGLATAILGTALVPSVLFLIPLYLLISQLGLFNTPGALLVAYPTFGLPMACWLMLGFFRALPEELEEAALIDGCTRWQAFLRIVLPLSRPALLAVTILTLTTAWNELLFASIFVRSEALWTLPRGLSAMATGDIFPYSRMFAASLLMTLPVIVLAGIGQRAMVSGLTAGAVKG